MDAERANVCDRLHGNVVRVAATDEYVSFITCTDHTNTDRVAYFGISEIHGTEPTARDSSRSHYALNKFASCEAHGLIKIVLSYGTFFWCQLIHCIAPFWNLSRI